MEFRTIGKNGPKVSRIGVGVWQASDLWKGDDEQIVRAIRRSHELGVNLVDTTEAYGNWHTEPVVGRGQIPPVPDRHRLKPGQVQLSTTRNRRGGPTLLQEEQHHNSSL